MHIFLKRIFILLIIFPICMLFSCSKNLSSERKALEVAQKSYALGGDRNVYRFIEKFIRQKGDDVKPVGWDVEKKSKNKYLVSYKYQVHSFDEGVGEKGFFFEVDLNDESVINKTDEYLKKMKPLSDTYKSEKEIYKDIINDDSMNVVR